MADQLGNVSKAQRIGGRGSIRRKLKGSKSIKPTQVDVSAVLQGFKKNLVKVNNVANFSVSYNESIQAFKSPDVRVIMADKKAPVAYVVTGKSKMINLKKRDAENKSNKADEAVQKENLKSIKSSGTQFEEKNGLPELEVEDID